MIYLYTAVLGGYALLWILSRREEGRDPFHKMAAYLVRNRERMLHRTADRRRDWRKDLFRRRLETKFKTLNPAVSAAVQVRNYYLSGYRTVLVVLFAGVLVCLIAWWSTHSSSLLVDGSYIRRNGHGGGDTQIELAAQLEGEEEEIFQYVVEAQKYTPEEAEELHRAASAALPEVICGENDSLEDVRHDLELVTKIEGYPFEVSWESSSYALVNTDGTVDNTKLEDGTVVMLTAHFKYERQTWDDQLYVQVNPVIYTHRELLRRRIEELLHIQQERTESEETLVLPDSVEGSAVTWREIAQDSSGCLLILAVLAAGLLYWGAGKELDRQLEQRKRELLLDYPEIVNKLALYMGAGMTIRNAFVKMGEDYKRKQKERRRYVYEEILIACNELQGGRSESEVYDHFGRRCQVSAYMKLGTLLSQNIRKGSNDLLSMLRQEADNAFAERRNLAKKLGEEAGTKLLLPMMMMLCIVMVIIMIPAYFSFTAG